MNCRREKQDFGIIPILKPTDKFEKSQTLKTTSKVRFMDDLNLNQIGDFDTKQTEEDQDDLMA
jgi:hypothetical protein